MKLLISSSAVSLGAKPKAFFNRSINKSKFP
jgi:hypothetical protein